MTAPQDTLVPWAPEDLPVAAESLAEHWHYVVLEEIVDEVALLRRWPWPSVDQLGHVIWSDHDEEAMDAATVDVEDLRTQLYQPNGIERHPRCGDTFAVTARAGPVWRSGGHATNVHAVLGESVYDISADAREAAKFAYQGSLAPVAPEEATDDATRVAQAAALQERSADPLPLLTVAAPPDEPAPRRRAVAT